MVVFRKSTKEPPKDLFTAISRGNLDVVQSLINEGVNPNLQKYEDPLTAVMIGDDYKRPIWKAVRSTKKNAPEITATLIQAVHEQNHNNPQALQNELIGNGLCDPKGQEPVGLKKCLEQLEQTNSPQSLTALAVLTDVNKGNELATQMIESTITKKLDKAGFKELPPKSILKKPSTSPSIGKESTTTLHGEQAKPKPKKVSFAERVSEKGDGYEINRDGMSI